MAVIPVSTGLIDETDSAVKLARYAQVVNISECGLMGVNNPSDPHYGCSGIWTHAQRAMLAKYLREAQDEIENEIGYPLAPRYFTNEQHRYAAAFRANWAYVIEAGVRAVAAIASGVAVSHAADPAMIGPVATTVTNIDEIRVYHPGTNVEIVPSATALSGGNVTLRIPRCRMVKAALEDTPPDGLDYNDTANFEATVDLKRVYTDATTQGVFVYPHQSSSDCDCGIACVCRVCGEATATACIYVRNGKLGYVDALKATQSGGTWTVDCDCGWCSERCWRMSPTYVRLNYKAGLTVLTYQAEDTITRLAHSKMPNQPCGCGIANEVWTRDRNTPAVLTGERLNCKFGLSDGAWIAWSFTEAMTMKRGGAI